MKGLTSVLGSFSEGLRVRKILPSLLEEVRFVYPERLKHVIDFFQKMKDTQLLPNILPNVFAIAHVISPTQFAALVLPSLKPLFALKDPPQNMMTLLENIKVLQQKTEKNVFLERMYDNLGKKTTLTFSCARCHALGL